MGRNAYWNRYEHGCGAARWHNNGRAHPIRRPSLLVGVAPLSASASGGGGGGETGREFAALVVFIAAPLVTRRPNRPQRPKQRKLKCRRAQGLLSEEVKRQLFLFLIFRSCRVYNLAPVLYYYGSSARHVLGTIEFHRAGRHGHKFALPTPQRNVTGPGTSTGETCRALGPRRGFRPAGFAANPVGCSFPAPARSIGHLLLLFTFHQYGRPTRPRRQARPRARAGGGRRRCVERWTNSPIDRECDANATSRAQRRQPRPGFACRTPVV